MAGTEWARRYWLLGIGGLVVVPGLSVVSTMLGAGTLVHVLWLFGTSSAYVFWGTVDAYRLRRTFQYSFQTYMFMGNYIGLLAYLVWSRRWRGALVGLLWFMYVMVVQLLLT